MHVEFISKIGEKTPNVFVLRHHHIRSNADILITFIAILKGGIAQLLKISNFKINLFPSASPSCNKNGNKIPASLYLELFGSRTNK